VTVRRLRSRPAFLVALWPLIALTAVACTPVTSSAPTSDVFVAVPWAEREQLTYDLLDDFGELLGTGTLEARREGDLLVLEQHYEEVEAPAGVAPTSDTVVLVVDGTTLRPLRGERQTVRRASDGTVTAESYVWAYELDGDSVRMTSVRERNGSRDERGLTVRDHYYDNESSLWLWRAIAFADAYEEYYVSVNAIERSQQTVNLRVPQVETVSVPAGEFEAWRILLRTGRAVRTAWIEVAPPHRILRWDNGDVIFELVESVEGP
jgi:hypothetical protein